MLGEPAQGIEQRHPNLTRASKAALRPFIGLPMISTRIREVCAATTHISHQNMSLMSISSHSIEGTTGYPPDRPGAAHANVQEAFHPSSSYINWVR